MRLDAEIIGGRIRKLRESTHKSQEEFAEMINTSSRTVSNIETGAVIPNIQTLANIAERCNSSVDMLIGIKEVK